jgi:hypothetical protein
MGPNKTREEEKHETKVSKRVEETHLFSCSRYPLRCVLMSSIKRLRPCGVGLTTRSLIEVPNWFIFNDK